MIYDILGAGILMFICGMVLVVVAVNVFVIFAPIFAKPIPVASKPQNKNLRVIERDYDYDTDY